MLRVCISPAPFRFSSPRQCMTRRRSPAWSMRSRPLHAWSTKRNTWPAQSTTTITWVCCQRNGDIPDSKVYGANMGPTWGRQDPGGPHDEPCYLGCYPDGHCWDLIVHWYPFHSSHCSILISQTQQCTSSISPNTLHCKRNMHIFFPRRCILAEWLDLWDWSIYGQVSNLRRVAVKRLIGYQGRLLWTEINYNII